MKKATAVSPANLAFVKYWGKKDRMLNLPCNNSISMNLSHAKTITTVQFDSNYEQDKIFVNDACISIDSNFGIRILKHIDRIRSIVSEKDKVLVTTNNTFPSGIGIASSASGFSALTLASIMALDIKMSAKEVSIISRLGSGSACRSIPDGFVEWLAGEDHSSSYAVQIVPPDYWDIVVITVILSERVKLTSSTDGHTLAQSSPFFVARLNTLQDRLFNVRHSILTRNFKVFGQEIESEALSFHITAMTSPFEKDNFWSSGIYYWLPETLEIILAVQKWRSQGLSVYFTMDAGPTVHLVCQKSSEEQVVDLVNGLAMQKEQRKWQLLRNYPANGAKVVDESKMLLDT